MKSSTLVALGSLFVLVAVMPAADPKDKEPPKKPLDLTPPGPLPLDKLVARNKELVPTLIEGLKDSDAQVRQTTSYILANLGKDAVKGLGEALTSKDPELRANAAYVLGQLGKNAQDAMPALIKAMKDENADVRQRAAYSIQRILADTPPPEPPEPPMPPATNGSPGPGAALPPGVVPASYAVPGVRLPADPGLLLKRGATPPPVYPPAASY